MGTINLETKDYVLTSLDAAFNDDVVQVVCQRLNIHRGRYWADPNLGSRFYTLKRSKDVPRMLQIVKQGEFKHEVRQFEKSYDNQQAEQISLMV